MNCRLQPGTRTGTVSIPSSKSYAHRLLIAAALSSGESTLLCRGLSADVLATIRCLSALGADIRALNDPEADACRPDILKPDTCCPGTLGADPSHEEDALLVRGIFSDRQSARSQDCTHPAWLLCGESGSTFRFLLPLAAALGHEAVFHLEGRLAQRPVAPLLKALAAHGIQYSYKGESGEQLSIRGQLSSGAYVIPGDISSQFITGLLFALPLLKGDSTLQVTGTLSSTGYISMTEEVLIRSGIAFSRQGSTWRIPGGQVWQPHRDTFVESDWSNAAPFLCMGALSPEGITVRDLPLSSTQGDKAILDILGRFGARVTVHPAAQSAALTEKMETPGPDGRKLQDITVQKGRLTGCTLDVQNIPDLVPVLSALAAGAQGTTRITHAERLRLKESDRLQTTAALLEDLGADIEELADGLIIRGKPELLGGQADCAADHRIAMAAAVAACLCRQAVETSGAECVAKSYPDFWKNFEALTVNTQKGQANGSGNI